MTRPVAEQPRCTCSSSDVFALDDDCPRHGTEASDRMLADWQAADTHHRVLQSCLTSWAYFRGWRAWRDRILYFHRTHSCSNLDDQHIGAHTCSCGARFDHLLNR